MISNHYTPVITQLRSVRNIKGRNVNWLQTGVLLLHDFGYMAYVFTLIYRYIQIICYVLVETDESITTGCVFASGILVERIKLIFYWDWNYRLYANFARRAASWFNISKAVEKYSWNCSIWLFFCDENALNYRVINLTDFEF